MLTGPRLVELCFQTAGLCEAGTDGRLALPLHVGAVRLDGSARGTGRTRAPIVTP